MILHSLQEDWLRRAVKLIILYPFHTHKEVRLWLRCGPRFGLRPSWGDGNPKDGLSLAKKNF